MVKADWFPLEIHPNTVLIWTHSFLMSVLLSGVCVWLTEKRGKANKGEYDCFYVCLRERRTFTVLNPNFLLNIKHLVCKMLLCSYSKACFFVCVFGILSWAAQLMC